MAAVLQSAVRVPSPEPSDTSPNGHTLPRKRSPTSRSPSPERRAPPLRRRSFSRSPSRDRRGQALRRRSFSQSPRHTNEPLPKDVDRSRALERQRQADQKKREEQNEPAKPLTAAEKAAAAKAEYERLMNMRSGGTYVPPAKLRALQAEIGTEPESKEFQRMAWEALKKSINGLINKVNVGNIKEIAPELFNENLIRGQGLFCRSIMKSQAASLPFTPIYAAVTAVVNSKLPQIGELLVNRLVKQFQKAFKRNDKAVCLSSTAFIAHLANQQVVHELLPAEILGLLLNEPNDDAVEVAVGLMKEVGQHLEDFNSAIAHSIFEEFRNILQKADVEKRTQYMIEVLLQVRRDKYKSYPPVKDELDLVEESDQIVHNIRLVGDHEVKDTLNIFKFDEQWAANEAAWSKLKAVILGGEEDSDGDDDESESSSEDEAEAEDREMEIKDHSSTDLVNLRRKIYLTIQSSGVFEEATHKLLRIDLPPGLEHEMVDMLISCASQEKTYNKFFGLIGERLCKLNRLWRDRFEEGFIRSYDEIHRKDSNQLRIVAQLFGHLLATDAIGWHVMSAIHINEAETTASSRIFVKILLEDLQAAMGMKKLQTRMREETLLPYLTGMFPTDNPTNTRFSINYFTAIKMGELTEGMREFLARMPKPAMPALPVRADSPSSQSASSYSSYSSRSRSPSRSRAGGRGRSYTRSISPARRGTRGRSYSDSRSPRRRARSYSDSISRSPSRRRRRSIDYSRSRSAAPRRSNRDSRTISRSRSPPPKRKGRYSDSISRSPPPRRRYDSSVSRSPPPRRRAREDSYSRSRSPPPRNGGRKRHSVSPSRSPPRRGPARASARYSRSPSLRRLPRRSPSYSRSRSPAPARRDPESHRPARGRQYTRSPSPAPKRKRNTSSPLSNRSRSPVRRGSDSYRPNRGRQHTRSPSPAPKRRRNTSSPLSERSRSPVRRRSYTPSRSRSRSRSPPRRRGGYRSRSPPRRGGRGGRGFGRGRGGRGGRRDSWTARRRNTSSPLSSPRSPRPRRASPGPTKPATNGKGKDEDMTDIHPSRRGLVQGGGAGGRGRPTAGDFL